MNFKERGITVGDLILTIIIIFTSVILVKTFNKDKSTSLKFINRETISYRKLFLNKFNQFGPT